MSTQAQLKKVAAVALLGVALNQTYRLAGKPIISGYHDYYYDQGGQLLPERTTRHNKLSNFFKKDTYTLLADDGKAYPIDDALTPLKSGKRRRIISADQTAVLMAAFVAKNAPKAEKMSLLEFKAASDQTREFDFKHSLLKNCPGCLYLDSGGVAHKTDWIGNITWGYLAAARGFPRVVAHMGAGVYEQLLIDHKSSLDWCTRTLCDDPRDYKAIDQGYAWRRSAPVPSATPEFASEAVKAH